LVKQSLMILQLQTQPIYKVEFQLNVSRLKIEFIMTNYKFKNETRRNRYLKTTMIIIQFKISQLIEEYAKTEEKF
jgi:hypothetical protein